MIKILKISVLILFLLPSVLYGEYRKNVLLLNSYHPGFVWTDNITSTIKEKLNSSGNDLNLFIEYMDTKRIPLNEISGDLIRIYKRKYQNIRIDAVICSDNNALDFAISHREGFLKDVPLVFCGINNFEKSMLQGQRGITGITENHNYPDTISLALRLHPEAEEIAVIGDLTTSSMLNMQKFRSDAGSFSGRYFYRELIGLPSEKMKQQLSGMNRNSVIFYIAYYMTESGERYTPDESMAFIKSCTELPVYVFDDSKVTQGAAGGFVVSSRHQGTRAAELALRVLNGESPDSIGIIDENRNVPIFDYGVLRSMGADMSLLPEDVVLVNHLPADMLGVIRNNRTVFCLITVVFLVLASAVILLQKSRLKHKMMETRLQKNEEKFRNLIEDMDEGVFTLNERGFITFVSSSIGRGGRYDADKLIGAHCRTVIHPDDRGKVDEYIAECLLNHIAPFETRVIDDRGMTNYVRTTIRARQDEETGETVISGLMVNISDIKDKESRLVQAIAEAEEANSIKGRFLANISHELRTPLNVIMGISDLLFQSEKDEVKKSYVSVIKSAGSSLLDLINDIFHFIEAEKDMPEDAEGAFSILEIIDELASFYRLDIEAKGLNFQFISDSSVADHYCGSQKDVKKALSNIFSNAVKFTEKGYVKVSVSSNDIQYPHAALVVSVEDSGIGIPVNDKSKIFDEFFRCDHGREEIYPGTGMGLAIARRIMERMKSDIQVSDSPSGGSIFRLIFNVSIPDTSGFSDEITEEACSRKRILLVEDNPTNRKLTSIILEKMNFNVDTAENGLEALNLVRSENYRAVLMDCQMPVMDGYEATREIQKIKDVPVIALTAHVFKEDRERCFESGMVDYLAKPINKRVLFSTLTKWVN